MLNGKSILVTGGTGSFGNKFVEMTIAKYPDVKRLVVYSRDELKQYEMNMLMPTEKYPRSFEAVEYLARYRGASAGVCTAEAFMLGRNIVKTGAF